MSEPSNYAMELAEYLSERFDGTTNHAERIAPDIQDALYAAKLEGAMEGLRERETLERAIQKACDRAQDIAEDIDDMIYDGDYVDQDENLEADHPLMRARRTLLYMRNDLSFALRGGK